MKNHNKLIYLLPLLAVLVFIIFSYKWNDEIITFDLNDFETVNCLVEDGGVIRTTEYDPQMNIDLDEAQQINVIYIKLFEPIDKDTTITAYFTKNRDMKFDEEYSAQGTIYSGKKDVALSINEKICSLRIDFGEDAEFVIYPFGEGGKITGDVTAHTIVCGGDIVGNVCADMLEILGQASIKGDIRAHKMMVEEGGRIEGKCKIGASEEAPQEEQDK